MSRPRAVPNDAVFAIATRLLSEGLEPTPRRVGDAIKQEYEATPSYSTLKQVLGEWRHLQGANLPADMPADFVASMVQALRPLYLKMAAQARAELAPQVVEADRRQVDAEAARALAESGRTRLADEVGYLRAQVADLSAQRQALETSVRTLTERASKAESALMTAAGEQHRVNQELAKVGEALVLERQALSEHREETARVLAQERRDHQQALATLRSAHTDELRRRNEDFAVEQERLQRELTRLNSELTRAKAATEVERAELRERIRTLEGQLTSLMEGRKALDRQYETLLSVIGKGGTR